MAKAGSYRWEGEDTKRRSQDEAHRQEVEEYDPDTGLFSDEDNTPLDDPYFELHTEAGPY
jgi:hypothetical protein